VPDVWITRYLPRKSSAGSCERVRELGDRLLRDAGDRRDLVEVLHQQRLRQHRKVARLAAIDVDVPFRDDPAVVRRAFAHVAHEAAELSSFRASNAAQPSFLARRTSRAFPIVTIISKSMAVSRRSRPLSFQA
jgi:hypothetical protein